MLKTVVFWLLALALAGGPTSSPAFIGDSEMTQRVRQDVDLARAEALYQTILASFYVPEFNLYREHSQVLPEDNAFSFLWPYSGMVSAANALAAAPGGEKYHADLARVLDGLEQYWDERADPPGYDSYVREYGGGQKYYDDNEWLGLDFVDAYRTLGDPVYLEKAKAMFAFAISGWSDDLGGGIYWRENDTATKNTCSNGPAAVLALKLYQETGEQQYLHWAVRILGWLKQLQAPSGVYWDSLSANRTIDFRTYTYNTGTIIHANALLYAETGEQRYLDEARALADASIAHFLRNDPASGRAFYPDTPWFNAVLLRGYVALYRVDPAHDPRYIETMRANLDYAWRHARGMEGFVNPDWAGDATARRGTDGKEGVYWLLDQAALVEMYATLAQLPLAW